VDLAPVLFMDRHPTMTGSLQFEELHPALLLLLLLAAMDNLLLVQKLTGETDLLVIHKVTHVLLHAKLHMDLPFVL
jgi:hypothetical protein